jgi:hypothetical protein
MQTDLMTQHRRGNVGNPGYLGSACARWTTCPLGSEIAGSPFRPKIGAAATARPIGCVGIGRGHRDPDWRRVSLEVASCLWPSPTRGSARGPRRGRRPQTPILSVPRSASAGRRLAKSAALRKQHRRLPPRALKITPIKFGQRVGIDAYNPPRRLRRVRGSDSITQRMRCASREPDAQHTRRWRLDRR